MSYKYAYTLQLYRQDKGVLGSINKTMQSFGYQEKVRMEYNETDFFTLSSEEPLSPDTLEAIRKDAQLKFDESFKDTDLNGVVRLKQG